MRITYNAPVTLTYALIATIALAADQLTGGAIIPAFFSVGGSMNPANPLDYLRLFAHVIGHSGWDHLIGNFAFILLLGPILEEKHGKGRLLLMIAITALATGLMNVIFLDTGLYGASGVVFMMIILSSFARARDGDIPLTFILVVLLYLTREILAAFRTDTVSQFAHIVGGVVGSIFGFFGSKSVKA